MKQTSTLSPTKCYVMFSLSPQQLEWIMIDSMFYAKPKAPLVISYQKLISCIFIKTRVALKISKKINKFSWSILIRTRKIAAIRAAFFYLLQRASAFGCKQWGHSGSTVCRKIVFGKKNFGKFFREFFFVEHFAGNFFGKFFLEFFSSFFSGFFSDLSCRRI